LTESRKTQKYVFPRKAYGKKFNKQFNDDELRELQKLDHLLENGDFH